ncbi:MAG: elongation factor 1-beta [Candidatus Aenigmarchaeota archaeon]|nr:elongation factor 1-beta [Candidatus Aenigmarchaeota archaeon]
MGKVAVTLKIVPEGPDTDVAMIEHILRKKIEVQQFRVVPIGFGVSVCEVMLIFEDKQGGSTDAIEKMISEIPGVASVETTDVTLI